MMSRSGSHSVTARVAGFAVSAWGWASVAAAEQAGGAADRLGSSAAQRVPGVSTGDWLQMILGLVLMVVLIFVCAALVRKMGGPVTGNSRHLRLLSVLPLGPRDRIALVQVGEEQIVVGLSAQGIRMLHVLQHPVADSGDPAGSDFARKITEMLRRERGQDATVDVSPGD